MKWWEWALWALFKAVEFVFACVGLVAFAVVGFLGGSLLYFAWDGETLWLLALCGIGVVAGAAGFVWLIELSDHIADRYAKRYIPGSPR